MANTPLVLADNFFEDTVLHPDHVVTQDGTEVEGSELFCAMDNLRDLTSFTVTEVNAQRIIKVDCLTAKSADMVVLDRGHNLAGTTVQVETSPDNAAWTNRVNALIPSSAGGLPGDANGTRTNDSVWWKTFSPVSARYWRFVIPALGTGISPIVTGLYLGAQYRFPWFLDAPGAYDYRVRHTVLKNSVSRKGVRVKRGIVNFSEIDLRLSEWEESEFLAIHPQANRLLLQNHPWWFCADDLAFTGGADLLKLYQLPGDMTFDPVNDPVHRSLQLMLEEVIPSAVL